MKALDTNIVVRLITRDDPDQFAAARALLEGGGELLLTPTVLLETEWVLRDVYRMSERHILAAFQALCATEHVRVSNAEAVADALRLVAARLELADALHVSCAAADKASTFVTFDRMLVKKAKRAPAPIPVEAASRRAVERP